MGIIIDLGGNPHKDRIGFRYWKAPYGPMYVFLAFPLTAYTDTFAFIRGSYKMEVLGQDQYHLSIFLGFWSVMINALFAFVSLW
jgi:amino acid transporter